MLADRIQLLYRQIHATNTEIARLAECSPSNISRLSTGARKPKPGSPTMEKLLRGVYLFSQKYQCMDALCRLIGADAGDTEERIKERLGAWLMAEDNAVGKQEKAGEKRAEEQNHSFSEKMNAIMNLISLSNVRLARAINVDASYISRLRNGVRTPKVNSELGTLLGRELFSRIKEHSKIEDLTILMNIPNEIAEEDREMIFMKWLFDSKVEPPSFEQFLDNLDRFSTKTMVMKLPESAQPDMEKILADRRTIYQGTEGIRAAVLRLLAAAAGNPGSELLLYSDEEMNWLTEDRGFLMQWAAMMMACIRSGVKVRIIHNMYREKDELIDALNMWIPLYMSGRIESHVFRSSPSDVFSHTLFLLPGHACISASNVREGDANKIYDYITNEERLTAMKQSFDVLLQKSEPLLQVFTDRNMLFLHEVSHNTLENRHRLLLTSPSFASMSPELLEEILERNEIVGEEREEIYNSYRIWNHRFLENSSENTIDEFVPAPADEELFAGQISICFGLEKWNGKLFYTPEEYGAHLREIKAHMKENPNYRFHFLPEAPFANIQIRHSNNSICVIKDGEPFAAFVSENRLLCKGFAAYFAMLEQSRFMEKENTESIIEKYQ